MSKPVVLTGIRANNDLHIGNYFGALLPMIDMATERSGDYQVNLFLPDLHSFTTPIDHSLLQKQIVHNLRLFVAAGLPLDNPDIHLYRQSYIPAHSELTWILDCFTGVGEMHRMTQYKDKSAKLAKQSGSKEDSAEAIDADETNSDRISVGLFNYPVLMASDILLHNAEYVPVGEDQSQHLEYTRDIAQRLNNKFADIFPDGLFVIPKPVSEQHHFFGKDQGLRVRDLQNPNSKMSKSDNSSKGIIFLTDNPQEAASKIMSATTDSVASIHMDWANQPGVSNLLQILALLSHDDIKHVISNWEDKSNYGELKSDVAKHLQEFLIAFQARLNSVDEKLIYKKLESSEELMRSSANSILLKTQQAVGLRPLREK